MLNTRTGSYSFLELSSGHRTSQPSWGACRSLCCMSQWRGRDFPSCSGPWPLVLEVETAVPLTLVSGASRPLYAAGAAHRLCCSARLPEHVWEMREGGSCVFGVVIPGEALLPGGRQGEISEWPVCLLHLPPYPVRSVAFRAAHPSKQELSVPRHVGVRER